MDKARLSGRTNAVRREVEGLAPVPNVETRGVYLRRHRALLGLATTGPRAISRAREQEVRP